MLAMQLTSTSSSLCGHGTNCIKVLKTMEGESHRHASVQGKNPFHIPRKERSLFLNEMAIEDVDEAT